MIGYMVLQFMRFWHIFKIIFTVVVKSTKEKKTDGKKTIDPARVKSEAQEKNVNTIKGTQFTILLRI